MLTPLFNWRNPRLTIGQMIDAIREEYPRRYQLMSFHTREQLEAALTRLPPPPERSVAVMNRLYKRLLVMQEAMIDDFKHRYTM